MKKIFFVKMAAAGNDFILVDNRKNALSGNLKEKAQLLCRRQHSIGADGLILLEKSKKASMRMRIFNPDGSEAEMCGNGVRCLAAFAKEIKAAKDKFSVETLSGVVDIVIKKEVVRARLVNPKKLQLGIRINAAGNEQRLYFVDTGVPHAVKFEEKLADTDVAGLGQAIRYHEIFSPKGTNVNFVCVKSPRAISVRTYERGVEAETLACGTGSTASALIAAVIKNLKSPISVHTTGGEVLKVYFSKGDEGFHDVYLEGEVKKSFEGSVSI